MSNTYKLDHDANGSVIFPPEAVRAIAPIAAREKCEPHAFVAAMARGLIEGHAHPWAIVLFSHALPVAGHIAELRGVQANLPMYSYKDHVRRQPAARPGHVAAVSAVMVRKKAVLQRLAPRSPILRPAWGALRDTAHTGTWLCLPDDPPEASLRETTSDNYLRFQRASIREASPVIIDPELMPASVSASIRDGLRYIDAAEWEAACHAWRRVVAAMPRSAPAWHMLGVSLGRVQRFAESRRTIARALVLQPDWHEAHYSQAIACRYTGELEAARRALLQFLAVDPFSESALLLMAEVCNLQADSAGAAGALTHYLELTPDDCEERERLGYLLHGMGRFRQAAQEYRNLAKREPENCRYWNNLGFCLAEAGITEEAVDACRQALAIKPDFETAWDSIGYAHLRAHRFEDAVAALLRAIELRPDYPDAWQHLIQAYEQSGQQERMQAAQSYFSRLDVPTHATTRGRGRG